MTDNTERDGPDVGRRRLLTGLALGGAAVAGGVVGGVTTAAASGGGFRRETLTLDVACLGDSWRFGTTVNPANDTDFRSSFGVEGWVYPEGTVPGDGFVPTASGAIGHWLCRGWVLVDNLRPEPHVMSTQEYVLDMISPEDLFAADNLTSSGIEGTETDQVAVRSVVGGTGRYIGATGQVTQANNGVNTSVMADGSDLPAPNFIFGFDLLLPDV